VTKSTHRRFSFKYVSRVQYFHHFDIYFTQSGELDTASGWHVTDLTRSTQVAATRTGSGALVIAADDLPFRAEDYFWLAPPLPYLGDLLTSYGQKLTLRVSWVSARGDTSGRPTMCADLVLSGDGLTIGMNSRPHLGNNASIEVIFLEEHWQHMLAPDQGTPVTRTEFLRVLAGLEHVMIRAKFHTDQIEGR
jgi:laminin alpha 1/2